MIKTTFEKGREEGREEGRKEGRKEEGANLLVIQIEAKFGSVSQRARKRIQRMTLDERRQLARRLATAQSRSELEL